MHAAEAVVPGGLLLSVSHAFRAPWAWADPDTTFPTPQQELVEIDLDPADWRRIEVAAPQHIATGPGGQAAPVTDNVIALERQMA